jgi:hypothetical protein
MDDRLSVSVRPHASVRFILASILDTGDYHQMTVMQYGITVCMTAW